MQAFTHPPFADKHVRQSATQPAKDGKVVLTQADTKALCVTCHSEQAEKIEKAKVPASRRAGRMHRLPQSACRQDAGLPAARSGRMPAWPATAIRPSSSRRRTCISRHSAGMRDLP